MSKQHKKHSRPSPGGQSQSRPSGKVVSRTEFFPAEEAEPVAERRPVPVWLIPLLVLLIFAGDMYLMDHGADVIGKTGAFPKTVFDPFKNYAEVVQRNPVSELDTVLNAGRAKFELYCAVCHQSSGIGNLATGIPPLAGSEWVKTPSPGRAIRIVLHSVRGPIKVADKMFDSSNMIAWAPVLSDEDIAAILTYIRANNDWGNKAPTVKPESVKQIRAKYASRTDPWTADELLKEPETE